MAIRSALEDFEETTLKAISGLLAKLHYLATLHDGKGNYSHWGMERIHGAEAAARAIRTAHVKVLTQVLRTPTRLLLEDVARSATTLQLNAGEFLRSLKMLVRQIFPERSMAASQKHFMAVLRALSALVERQESANHPGASPLRPLVQ